MNQLEVDYRTTVMPLQASKLCLTSDPAARPKSQQPPKPPFIRLSSSLSSTTAVIDDQKVYIRRPESSSCFLFFYSLRLQCKNSGNTEKVRSLFFKKASMHGKGDVQLRVLSLIDFVRLKQHGDPIVRQQT